MNNANLLSIYRTYDETDLNHLQAISLAAKDAEKYAAQGGILYGAYYVDYLAEALTELFSDMDQDTAEYMAGQLLKEDLAEQDAAQ